MGHFYFSLAVPSLLNFPLGSSRYQRDPASSREAPSVRSSVDPFVFDSQGSSYYLAADYGTCYAYSRRRRRPLMPPGARPRNVGARARQKRASSRGLRGERDAAGSWKTYFTLNYEPCPGQPRDSTRRTLYAIDISGGIDRMSGHSRFLTVRRFPRQHFPRVIHRALRLSLFNSRSSKTLSATRFPRAICYLSTALSLNPPTSFGSILIRDITFALYIFRVVITTNRKLLILFFFPTLPFFVPRYSRRQISCTISLS